MTKEQLFEAVKVAYNYGIQQTSKRQEPILTILNWAGWKKVSKENENFIYAAYKSGWKAEKVENLTSIDLIGYTDEQLKGNEVYKV